MGVMPRRPVALAFVALTLVGACTFADSSDDPPQSSAPPDLLPATNDALPTMDVDGFHTMLGQLEGRPVVVNVWASWCVPCERELPLLTAAASQHPGVQFVGVNTQDSRQGAEDFIREYAIAYPSVFDPDGAIIVDLDAIGPPVTVFYAADGTEVASVVGELSETALAANLASITG